MPDPIDYYPTPTAERFHLSDAFYRVLMGPVGSSKSTACCMEILDRARRQEPQKDGVRRTRFAIIRNTNSQLEDTSLKTWQDWVKPEAFGNPSMTYPIDHQLYFPLKDGTIVDSLIMFRPLDKPKDITRVLSLELTGAWINEIRELPRGLVDAIGDRVGRYPAQKDGGPTWEGVIGDTNMPDEDHWIYRMAEEVRPRTWEFFKQPGGLIEQGETFILNPLAENIQNLPKDYYIKRMEGKEKPYVRVYYCAQYGFVVDGKPVYPEYIDAIHASHTVLEPMRDVLAYVGLDYGLTPAAYFCQRLPNGRWITFDEICSEDLGIKRFGEYALGPKLRGEYAGLTVKIFGDPSGNTRVPTDEDTCEKILGALGIPVVSAPSNNFTLRREAAAAPMGRMIDGKPGFLISPRCKIARKGYMGGYKFRRVQVSGDERYHDEPDKNFYSHICEGGQYAFLGAGEGKALIKLPQIPRKPRRPDRISSEGGSWMAS